VPVSPDSTELQRATLERKDKEELTTIAAAMGVKASSRSRKADLVDLILTASGAASGRSAAATNGGTPDPAPDADANPTSGGSPAAAAPAPVAEAATEVTPADAPPPAAEPVTAEPAEATRRRPPARLVGWSGDAGAPAASATRSEPAREEPSLFDPASADRQADAAATNTGSADDSPADDRADGNRGERAADPADRDDDRQTDDRDAADGEPNDGPSDGGADGERGAADGETGNRRRRRRGRDRDRKPEDRPGAERAERTDRPERAPHEENLTPEPLPVAGHLDLRDEGYGFLRINGYLPSRDDAYVSVRQARQLGLRRGDYITGASRPAGRNEKNPALLRIDTVNGGDPELARTRPRFEDLTALFPDEKLRMEVKDDPTNMTARIIDLMAPIGKGTRGLIVSPPKAGKTTIMKQIARSIEINNPEVHLIVLLVDERPEEVTDMRRWLTNGEVAASTFDRPADEHILVAELTIERAKRLVETGRDVVIILDGITRLARAYNMAAPTTGRVMSGGIDTGAIYPPKKFFGAARNVEEGGSLTILATALVETGSRMDEVIFEEFKGTGNMELRLDRRLAERRIYPAIDAEASSTRHEELLMDRKALQQVWKLRRVMSGLRSDGDGGAAAGLELLIDRLKSFRNNDEFLAEVAKGPAA
jgi:transcription termination factor Rho